MTRKRLFDFTSLVLMAFGLNAILGFSITPSTWFVFIAGGIFYAMWESRS